MPDKYTPNINATYSSKAEFLAGENIPEEFWDYFEEYDPSKEELLEDEHSLAALKARFELNNQKRTLFSQTSKMGFATSGEMNKGMKDLMTVFEEQQDVQAQADTLAIEDVQRNWLDSQFTTAASIAEDIESSNRTASELITDINNADSHWERKHLDTYKDSPDERKFLKYMDDQGKSNWEQWKKPLLTDKRELKKQYNKNKHSDYTAPEKG